MKLLSIRLRNVRRFTDTVEISGIGSGLNVLTAPNEHGKSTAFDALHAAFFKNHRSWDKDVSSLAPHAGGDPEVVVEFETDDRRYKVEKRWNKNRKGEASVYANGNLLKQADDAEAWLADALKAPTEGGPAGLLWVRQGLTAFDKKDDTGRTARRDLLSSVAGEVEAMTGGRQMEAALNRCRQELDRFVTKSGKAKAGGPFKSAEDDVAALESQREELAGKANALRSQIDNRGKLRRELAVIEDPEAEATNKERLADAEKAYAEAKSHADKLERAIEAERTKGIEVDRAKEKLDALTASLTEAKEANTALKAAKAEAAAKSGQLGEAEKARDEAGEAYEAAKREADRASETHRLAVLAEVAKTTAERREELTKRLAKAEELRTRLEKARASAKAGLSAKALEELEDLEDEVRIFRKTRESESAGVTMHYISGRTQGVSLTGHDLPDGERVAIPDGATLEIEGIGKLTVHPGAGAGKDELVAAERELADALKERNFETIDAARKAASQRAEAESLCRDIESQLQITAPDGIDGLREKIAKLPEPVQVEAELPSAADAEEAEAEAKRVTADANEALEKARSVFTNVQAASARAMAAVESAEERVTRSNAALAKFEDPEAEEARLADELGGLQENLAELMGRREELANAAPDLEAAKATWDRAKSVIERAENDQQRIRRELAGLDATIEVYSADAVDEELADVEARLSAAQRKLDEVEFEVAVLLRLESALEHARDTARDQYVEPVLAELAPLVRLFWPEAELRMDAENVLPTHLVRAGTEEDFDILSGGTQEQIALLVRLAFARMLAKSGHPAPVILDDAIVYTDDDRIERMFDALTRQAQDLQILVFSCRQKAFRDLGGQSLSLTHVQAQPENAS